VNERRINEEREVKLVVSGRTMGRKEKNGRRGGEEENEIEGRMC